METKKNSRKQRRSAGSVIEAIRKRLVEAQQRVKEDEIAVARARDRVEDLEDILADSEKRSGEPESG